MIKVLFILIPILFSCSHKTHHHAHKAGHRNEMYLNPKLDAQQKNTDFESADRDVIVQKENIIAHLPLNKGDYVADVGAGTGIFESGLSRKVGPHGKIYAIDIAPSFIPFMKERFAKEKLNNVEVILAKTDSTTLKQNSVNLVLVIDTYHHFDDARKMLADFRKILKKNGHLVIVDFNRTPDAREWILYHVDKTKEQYIEEITKEGFEFIREEKIPFKENFQLTFRKR